MAPSKSGRASALHELYRSTSHTRRLLTTVTAPFNQSAHVGSGTTVDQDFLSLITTLCAVYRSYAGDLVPMQSFNKDAELIEDGGATCIVTSKAISTHAPSNLERGRREEVNEKIIVKRTRKGVLEPKSSAMRSFITELRVRSHLPLRFHPHIVDLKGVAWDYGEGESRVPRPLLLEEFAPERSLAHFWRRRNLTRMPFKVKAELCLDIAHGISILHECSIVHGDIKPDNILIFPKVGASDEFTAKLTDFGHSVCEFEDLRALPAFTKQYCAPEADPEYNAYVNMTFDGMKRTDAYSFGLVVLSIVIGQSFLSSFKDDLDSSKREDKMAIAAMGLVEKQDKENNDSDFDLDVLDTIFSNTIAVEPSQRSLPRCITVLENYIEMQKSVPRPTIPRSLWQGPKELTSTDPNELAIGYQSLSQCSHVLKQKIFTTLLQVAADDNDARSPLACWELSICCFAEFGVDRDSHQSLRWLVKAAEKGAFVAQAYFLRLHHAIDPKANPAESLLGGGVRNAASEPAAEKLISDWLYSASLAGCFDILPDLESRDPQRHAIVRKKLIESPKASHPSSHTDFRPDLSILDENNVISGNDAPVLHQNITTALANEDLSPLLRIIESNQQAVNHRDEHGDTALIHAVRSGQFRFAKLLLNLPHIDASIQNQDQQDALHLVTNLTDEEAEELIPTLVERGASITAEAPPSARHAEGLDLTPRPRSCIVLRSVLLNRVRILKAVLDAAHMPGKQRQCRVCESGSRYRKILAFAVSLHRSAALEVILDHLKSENEDVKAGLDTIEVWVGKELLHVWNLAIKPPHAVALDLPEPLVRALNYGREYKPALERTLSLIWQSIPDFLPVGRWQLEQAVIEQNLEAIDFLIAESSRRGLSADKWWVISNEWDVRKSPLFLSVQIGHRNVFRKMLSIAPQAIRQPHRVPCCVQRCAMCRRPFNYTRLGNLLAFIFLSWRDKSHQVNLAQMLLALATVAPHQDLYFVEFFLNNSPPKLLTSPPTVFDERFSRQPSSFLAQSILTCEFQGADIIMRRFPKLLEQQPVLVMSDYKRRLDEADLSESYTSASKSILLRFDDNTIPKQFSLKLYILLVGSYQSCAYLLRNLHKARVRQQCQPSAKTSPDNSSVEAATHHWSEYALKKDELHTLLVGLVKDDRPDRYLLWDVVASQLCPGQPRDSFYANMALNYANSKALTELIRLGWDLNKPPIRRLYPALSYAKLLEADGEWLPTNYSRAVYPLLAKQKERALKKNVLILEETDARRTPLTPGFWLLCYVPATFAIYGLIVPLTVSFKLESECLTRSNIIGRICVISVLAAICPPFFVFLSPNMMYHMQSHPLALRLRCIFFPLLWLGNNVLLPFLTFRNCWDDLFYMLIIPEFFLFISVWVLFSL